MTASIIPHDTLRPEDSPAFQPGHVNFTNIPLDLRDRGQWAVRRAKVPVDPVGNAFARPNDPATWVSFEQARASYLRGGYDGIGFMLSSNDPLTVLDFDHCYDPDAERITRPDVAVLVARFDTYTEISPSGTGLHVYLRATPPKQNSTRKSADVSYEVYSANHFITVTGQRLPGTPATIEARQDVFDTWYHEAFPSSTPASHAESPVEPPTTTDEAIIRRAMRAQNGDKFRQLWEGDWSGYASRSEADQALMNLLAFYTRHPEQLERLFRQSGLVWDGSGHLREKWTRADYIQRTIETALETVTETSQPRKREERRVTYTYDWQQRGEGLGEREAYLQQQANEARDRAQAHIEAQETTPLVIANAPGVGKTTTLAPLGQTFNLAWIGQRHDMYEDVAKHGPYLHVQPATPENCRDADLLNLLASLKNNVYPVHRQHDCDYYRQHEQEGSAFYQVKHVPTSFPKRHQAAIVDELDLSSWLDDHVITRTEVEEARKQERWLNPYFEAGGYLLRALSDTMLEAIQRRTPLYGKALFDTLNRYSRGGLATLLAEVEKQPSMMEERPQIANEADITRAQVWGKVIVPYVVRALREDLPKWERGGEWNSRIHLDSEGTLHIIRPLRFQTDDKPFPVVISDATADTHLYSLLFGQPVQVKRQDTTPPPSMRHVAVRVKTTNGGVKRYSKSALEGKDAAQYRDRVIRELRHLLKQENPDGKLTVGLITYQSVVAELGEALGIPEERRGNFWGVRGSNRFKDCDILIVVGTPTLPLSAVEWWARALYADEPNPIDTAPDEQTRQYRDERMAGLVEYLVNSELTQVAHRNRPIRFDGRTVISLTSGKIDFLPITEEITEFPDLPTQKRIDQKAQTSQEQGERLAQVFQAILARGERMSVRLLAREAKVKTQVAGDWLRERREHA